MISKNEIKLIKSLSSKKNRLKVKKINLNINYNFNQKIMSLKNIKINNKIIKDSNQTFKKIILKNDNTQNKIYIKNIFNELIDFYAG